MKREMSERVHEREGQPVCQCSGCAGANKRGGVSLDRTTYQEREGKIVSREDQTSMGPNWALLLRSSLAPDTSLRRHRKWADEGSKEGCVLVSLPWAFARSPFEFFFFSNFWRPWVANSVLGWRLKAKVAYLWPQKYLIKSLERLWKRDRIRLLSKAQTWNSS